MDTQKLQIQFFLALLIAVFLLTAIILYPFLAPLAIGLMFAVVLKPVHEFFLRKLKSRKTLSAVATVTFFICVILTPLSYIGVVAFNEMYDFYIHFDTAGVGKFTTLTQTVDGFVNRYYPSLNFSLASYTDEVANWAVGHIGVLFAKTTDFGASLLIAIIGLFFFVRDGGIFRRKLIEISPLADKYDKEIITHLVQAVNSVVRGSLFTALLQGTLLAVGFAVFGIPHAVLWGTLAALAALLPTGTALVLIPGVIYLFTQDQTVQAIGLSIWGFFAVGTIDNILMPFFIGKGFRAHPFFLLLSVFGGLLFFGPVGILLGPLVIALLMALIEIYRLLVLDDVSKRVTKL